MLAVDLYISNRYASSVNLNWWARTSPSVRFRYVGHYISVKSRTNMSDDAKLQKVDPDAVSPLVSINGTNVATYLESYANGQNLQDRDAQ